MIEKVKLRAGQYMRPATLEYDGKRIYISFPFNRTLMESIKAMKSPKWHGYDKPNPRKIWSIEDCPRNRFQLSFLRGNNAYYRYDKPLEDIKPRRSLYSHQVTMFQHLLTRNYIINAGEMGTGKTLPMIEAAEWLQQNKDIQDKDIWYVGPRSGVEAVKREFAKWESFVRPKFFTYGKLVNILKSWTGDAPRFVMFDECSKIKTPTAQRSQAAMYVADCIREEHGDDGYAAFMSGTPAPKAPIDWWNIVETACPGFFKEGDINKFKRMLCLIEERDSITGGRYPHVVTWWDDERKCKHCGQPESAGQHDPANMCDGGYHRFEPSTNEVKRLYDKMKGLTEVFFSKDCLDLPEKRYRIIQVKPTPSTLQTVKSIKATTSKAVEALTLLRELSDGFQYKQRQVSTKECPNCYGKKEVEIRIPINPEGQSTDNVNLDTKYKLETVKCDHCKGTGKVPVMERYSEFVDCPKDKVLLDQLEEHEDVGRYIVWGGFTGTIDRLVKIITAQKWLVLRIDGRGYIPFGDNDATKDILLDCMDGSHPKKQELLEKYPKVCVVGHPKAGGMALTFTASRTMMYYSNPYDGEARMQSEKRHHRAGMDVNRGATIIDLIHLQTDLRILDNLKQKKRLQDLTMGELYDVVESKYEIERY